MTIDSALLDSLTAQAKAVGQWHSVNVLEPTVILECKDGPYEPIGEEDILAVE